MNNNHDPIAVPRPALDTNIEVRRVLQSGAGTDFSDEEASNRRLAQIEIESAKFKQVRKEESDINSTAERLTAALQRRSEERR